MGGQDQRGGTGHNDVKSFLASVALNVRVGQFHVINRMEDPFAALGKACRAARG